MKWIALLFPYRSHLESEIDYLRTMLAQQERRRDELEAVLAEIAKPQPKVQFERKLDGKLIPIHPLGWDAYRDKRRAETSQAQSDETKEQNARSNG